MKEEVCYDISLSEWDIDGILAAIECAECARSGTNLVMEYGRQQRLRAMLCKKLTEIRRY